MSFTYSRPPKLGHSDTVLYEIYLLRFAASALRDGRFDKDAWVYLEAFLLHFRNLVSFLAMEKPGRQTDLCATAMWKERGYSTDALDVIHKIGKALNWEYEPNDERGGGRISEYLAHCTTTRVIPKVWEIDRMYGQIEPALGILEKHLQPTQGFLEFVKPVRAVEFRLPLQGSTMIGTHTASSVVRIK
jgi:hypothetical protein